MFKKRRIKKDYDAALAEGETGDAEKILKENPWLQDYIEEDDDAEIGFKQICGAIGIMEDELHGPVPIDEVLYCLEMDFSNKMPASELESLLISLEAKNYIKNEAGGYTLTIEGGRICDNYLNKISRELHQELELDSI
ncbi:hypothetical protein GF325_00105 [Candidatus Bathyarchaeota archaeon]|nr:hypothetical protein [Candidatus Bathyarchaeota archaeon]